MPRRKQADPRKHRDGGTDSTSTTTTETEEATGDGDGPVLAAEKAVELKVEAKESSKKTPASPVPSQHILVPAPKNDMIDTVLDLSVRKRPRNDNSIPPGEAKVHLEKRDCSGSPQKKAPETNLLERSATSAFAPHFSWISSLAAAANFVNSAAPADKESASATGAFISAYAPPFPFHPPPFLGQTPLVPTSTICSPKVSNCKTTGACGAPNVNALSKLSSLVHQVGKGQAASMGPNAQSNSTPASARMIEERNDRIQDAAAATANGCLQDALTAGGHGLSFKELWLRFVKKEENAELKRLNEAKQIFTCLQCHASFQTMEQLVKHMEQTQHYANIPKHYSWSLQYARQRMRQMKMKMKYSDKMMYYCFLCTSPFTEPVHMHFNCIHNMHNPVENMKFVHVISVNGKNATGSGSTSKLPVVQPGSSPSPSSASGRRGSQQKARSIKTLSSPTSSASSRCDSEAGSVSPGSSTASANFRPPVEPSCSSKTSSTIVSTDTLLSKMERMVRTAAEERKN